MNEKDIWSIIVTFQACCDSKFGTERILVLFFIFWFWYIFDQPFAAYTGPKTIGRPNAIGDKCVDKFDHVW